MPSSVSFTDNACLHVLFSLVAFPTSHLAELVTVKDYFQQLEPSLMSNVSSAASLTSKMSNDPLGERLIQSSRRYNAIDNGDWRLVDCVHCAGQIAQMSYLDTFLLVEVCGLFKIILNFRNASTPALQPPSLTENRFFAEHCDGSRAGPDYPLTLLVDVLVMGKLFVDVACAVVKRRIYPNSSKRKSKGCHNGSHSNQETFFMYAGMNGLADDLGKKLVNGSIQCGALIILNMDKSIEIVSMDCGRAYGAGPASP
ncbi:hypothetical protein K439DRAFT_1611493 [Ramaria rubella]|nr:hypothetical protein K439DRAFT_1611493 [Ramaria rubella]